MTIFYFSATGNSLAIAKQIGGSLISIPQVVDAPQTHYKDDVIGILFPIYCLTMPKIVHAFLNKVTFEADYTFAIGTYGNQPGACMQNVQKLALERGYRFDYANDLLMLDNYLPVFDMEAEISKLPQKKVEENTSVILADIRGRKNRQANASFVARLITSAIKVIIPLEKMKLGHTVDSICSKCGTCAKVCPAKNVTVDGSVRFGSRCEGCLACVHLCPKSAIHVKGEKGVKRWRHPHVSVAELIAANNRMNK